jgi:hypothetical protein
MTSQPVCKQVFFGNNQIIYVALHVLVLWEPLDLFYCYDYVTYYAKILRNCKEVPFTVEPVKMVPKDQIM